jgi:hypothetical protein
VGATTNARCIDFVHREKLGQDAAEAEKERELIACLRRMNVITTDTCINYQTVYQPHLGERVDRGDTGTVIYGNSVFGARTNFESGPAALAAAIPAHALACRCALVDVEVIDAHTRQGRLNHLERATAARSDGAARAGGPTLSDAGVALRLSARAVALARRVLAAEG